jgi:hypothetical protein
LASATYGTAVAHSDPLYIGADADAPAQPIQNGFMDEIRISKGVYRYTGATYNVPRAPFTADGNTVLLLHCDYDARDSSSSAHTPTVGGSGTHDTDISSMGRFPPIDDGGPSSVVVDGTNEYISIPNDSLSFDLFNNTIQNWTIDTWFALKDRRDFVLCAYYGVGNDDWRIRFVAGSGFQIFGQRGGVTNLSSSYTGDMQDGMWHHLACIKVGSIIGIYIDGTQLAAETIGGVGTAGYITSGVFYIGQLGNSTNYFYGWIDEFRIQYGNYFNASPADPAAGDTITVPTVEYAVQAGPSGIAEINSVANANIGYVNSVDWNNVASVNSVS